MDEHRTPAVDIGQLNLRVPGASVEAGHGVANAIALSLARKVPARMRRQLGAINLRVQLPAGASEADISGAVAEAIVKALHRGSKAAVGRQS
jgi:hypothetical protein